MARGISPDTAARSRHHSDLGGEAYVFTLIFLTVLHLDLVSIAFPIQSFGNTIADVSYDLILTRSYWYQKVPTFDEL